MLRWLFFVKASILLLIVSLNPILCDGQLKRNVSVQLLGNYNFKLRDFGTNDDAGIGGTATVMLRTKKKFGLTTEGMVDYFVGDKGPYGLGDVGRYNGPRSIYSLRAGPHYFITKRLMTSFLLGVAHHCLKEYDYNNDASFKISATALLGLRKRLVTRFYYVWLKKDEEHNPNYIGVSLGLRLH